MARSVAELPAGPRITDYISLGVITRTFPAERIRTLLAATGRASVRERDLPALVVVYYVIALALYMQSSLKAEDGGRAALEAVRGLIERVEIGPPAAGAAKGSPTIVLTGEIASMVALALEDGPRTRNAARFGPVDHDLFARSVKVVAGTRNHRELPNRRVAC